MIFLSGCYDDRFLEAMNEEEDFIAPFDVVLNDIDEATRTTYFAIPDLDTTGNYTINPESVEGVTTHGIAADGEDNVVLDKTTGLMWTRCSMYESDPDATPDSGDETNEMDKTSACGNTPKSIEWIYAADFCKKTMNEMNAGAGYAGFTDWRLPRLAELISIINFNSTDPIVNQSAFPGTINVTDGGYWTFTSKLFVGEYFETIDYAWIIFFKSSWAQSTSLTNIADFRKKTDYSTSEKQYVRCVRGGIVDSY